MEKTIEKQPNKELGLWILMVLDCICETLIFGT